MNIVLAQKLAVDALEDVKAKDIVVLDTKPLTSLFDCMIIASGDSNRQVRALGNSVREKLKENGFEIVGMEGEMYGEWVLVDAGSLIVHIMQPAVRDYYNIEQLWGGQKPSLVAPSARPWNPAANTDTDVK